MEFKVIFGDLKEIILIDYVKKYFVFFFNFEGGDILFGIEEDWIIKVGFVVGVFLLVDDWKEFLYKSSKIICNFWLLVESC